MPEGTIISEDLRRVDVRVVDDLLLVPVDRLPDAIGWELKPQGLCRDDVCVPVADRDGVVRDGWADVGAVASALGRQSVVDAGARIAAIAVDGESRRRALESLHAPSFTLQDLDGHDHQLEEWRGRKKLFVAFSSW
jgi:hypothetical protein